MFQDLGLSTPLLASIAKQGFVEPTPIQSGAIPIIRQGLDLLGVAKTGSGKTCAYVLPIVEALTNEPTSQNPRAMVAVPARELADQVEAVFREYTQGFGLRSCVLVGGEPKARQLAMMRDGIDIVVGTPGRMLDFARSAEMSFEGIKTLVLDEADRLLENNMRDEVLELIGHAPRGHQSILLSATLPTEVRSLARKIQRDPRLVEIDTDLPAKIQHVAVVVRTRDKFLTLVKVLQREQPGCCFTFVDTKDEAEAVSMKLRAFGHDSESFRGDLALSQRRTRMQRLRDGGSLVMVATDVLGRGIDIIDMDLVINYGMPKNPDVYIHRSGRTGRAGREGKVISIITSRDLRRMEVFLERRGIQLETLELGAVLPKVPDTRRIMPEYSVVDVSAVVRAQIESFERGLTQLFDPSLRGQLRLAVGSGAPQLHWAKPEEAREGLIENLIQPVTWTSDQDPILRDRIWREALYQQDAPEIWTERFGQYAARMLLRELLHNGSANRDILLSAITSSQFRDFWVSAIESAVLPVPNYLPGGTRIAQWVPDERLRELLSPLIVEAELAGIGIVPAVRNDTQMLRVHCQSHRVQDLSEIRAICQKIANDSGWKVELVPILLEQLPPEARDLTIFVQSHQHHGNVPRIVRVRTASNGRNIEVSLGVDLIDERYKYLVDKITAIDTRVVLVAANDESATYHPVAGTYFMKLRAKK